MRGGWPWLGWLGGLDRFRAGLFWGECRILSIWECCGGGRMVVASGVGVALVLGVPMKTTSARRRESARHDDIK